MHEKCTKWSKMMYMSKFIYGAGRLSVSWAPETPDMRPGVLSHHHLMVCVWDAGGGGRAVSCVTRSVQASGWGPRRQTVQLRGGVAAR